MTITSLDEATISQTNTKSLEEIVAENLTQEKLYAAISVLTEEQQQVIILKFLVNLSNAQIAQFLNKTEGGVKSLQHRALNSLQKILKGETPDERQV